MRRNVLTYSTVYLCLFLLYLDVLILIKAVYCIDGLSACFASGKAYIDASVAQTAISTERIVDYNVYGYTLSIFAQAHAW